MVSSEVLQGTYFYWTYNLLGVSGDEDLIYRMTVIAIVYTAVVGILSILSKPAPYGRHSDTKSKFSISMNATAAWIIQEAPAFIVPLILIIQTPSSKLRDSNANKVALLLFMAHYFQRTFIFPFRITNPKPAPVSNTLMAFLFCFYNGLLQGHYLINVVTVELSAFTLLGAVLFVTGMGINIYHDGVLIGLRKDSGKTAEGKSNYKIPRGGLFELISGANYFGEIVEWWGLFVATKGIPQLTFAVFTNIFLGLRATHHHQWYKKTFGNSYPAKRKAIVPYVI